MLPNHFCFQITIITIVTIILYILKEHEHVALVRNISNVVVNSSKIKGLRRFVKTKNRKIRQMFAICLQTK